jgi:hypothetical protein
LIAQTGSKRSAWFVSVFLTLLAGSVLVLGLALSGCGTKKQESNQSMEEQAAPPEADQSASTPAAMPDTGMVDAMSDTVQGQH